MTHKIRGVDVEKCAYYINKLRQNVGLETCKWRQIVTSQTAHTKYKWPPMTLNQSSPMKIFCVLHCRRNRPKLPGRTTQPQFYAVVAI